MGAVPSRRRTVRRQVQLTERDRELLTFVADHRLVLADQAQALLGVAESTARARLRGLASAGYLNKQRIFHRQPESFQVSARGLAAIGSSLSKPRIDLREYVHDVGLGWLWLAARSGAFGPVSEVISERNLRSRDGLPRVAGMPFGADGLDSGVRQGVRLAGVGRGGREQLHYPDLVVKTADGRRIAFELELTGKGRARREKILSGYAAARNVDAVVYLVNQPSVERSIRASVAKLDVSDRVQVRRFAWTPSMERLAGHLSPGRSSERAAGREAAP